MKFVGSGVLMSLIFGGVTYFTAATPSLANALAIAAVEIDLVCTGSIQQACPNRSSDIFHRAANDSTYGRITFATRQICA